MTPDRLPLTAARLMRRSVARHRGAMTGATAFLVLWQVCEVAVPIAIGVTVDLAILPLDLTALLWCLLGIAALFTVLSYAYRFGSRMSVGAMQREAHQLRMEVARVPLGPRAGRYRSGEVLSLSSADADLAAQALRQFARGGTAIAGLLAASVYLFAADPLVGLVVVIGVPLSIALVALPGRRLSRRSARQQEAIGFAGRLASDLMKGLRVLKAVGGEPWARGTFRRASDAAAGAGAVTADRLGRVDALGSLSAALVLGGVLLAAGLRVVDGELSLGALIAIVGVAVFFSEPLRTLAETAGVLARSHGAAGRIADFLADAPPGDHPGALPRGGALQVRGLALGGGRSLDADVPEGHFLTLAVDQPAAARAIALALAGEGEQAHAVSIGGVPRDEAGPGLAPCLVVAPHESDLFEGTVRSNITLSQDSRPVAGGVLRASATGELLSLLPGGLDEPLHDEGRNLSGGQRQRIALARALHADPRTLVLHDPTSAVDALTEWEIARGLRELRRGRTTVVISSSPGFLSVADTVIHIPAAGPLERGPHPDLIERSAAYRAAVAR